MTRTITVPLVFNGVNTATFNIQGAQIENIMKIIVKQATVVNDPASVPPVGVPACSVWCDLITTEQSLCSVLLTPSSEFTTNLDVLLDSTVANVSGNHTFRLQFTPNVSYDWSQINTTLLLTLTFL